MDAHHDDSRSSAVLEINMHICDAFFDQGTTDVPVRGFLHRSSVSGADCLIFPRGEVDVTTKGKGHALRGPPSNTLF
jgi:hypothetical protein